MIFPVSLIFQILAVHPWMQVNVLLFEDVPQALGTSSNPNLKLFTLKIMINVS